MEATRILILGGGFGGATVYKELHKRLHGRRLPIQVELIDQNNYLTFYPMLHEAATGSVAREHVVQPLRELVACCGNDFHQATVKHIEPASKTVVTDTQEHSYDVLVIALGVAQGYFGTPGAEDHALALKSLPDAIRIKNRIIHAYEQASEAHDRGEDAKAGAYLHFVIVGGGATGTEMAGQLADLMRGDLRRLYPDVPHEKATITLVHAGERLLEQMSEPASTEGRERLKQMGVTVRFNEAVAEVRADGVRLASGEEIDSRNVLWTAGTQSQLEAIVPKEFLNERGLMDTNAHYQVEGVEDVFALGDCATVTDSAYAGPPTAQAAVQQAEVVAQNVLGSLTHRPLTKRTFRNKGDIIPIGDWYAIFENRWFRFNGRLAWWMRRTVFLTTMFSWGKRLRVVSDWTIQIFQPRDTSEF